MYKRAFELNLERWIGSVFWGGGGKDEGFQVKKIKKSIKARSLHSAFGILS